MVAVGIHIQAQGHLGIHLERIGLQQIGDPARMHPQGDDHGRRRGEAERHIESHPDFEGLARWWRGLLEGVHGSP